LLFWREVRPKEERVTQEKKDGCGEIGEPTSGTGLHGARKKPSKSFSQKSTAQRKEKGRKII